MRNISCIAPEIWSTNENNFLSFWPIFCPFTSLTTQKIKILRKWKKYQMSSSYTSVPKIMIICITVLEMQSLTVDVIFIFPFGYFLFFYHPNKTNTSNFIKIKKHLDITAFYTCVTKIMITWCRVRVHTWQKHGETGREKKPHFHRIIRIETKI